MTGSFVVPFPVLIDIDMLVTFDDGDTMTFPLTVIYPFMWIFMKKPWKKLLEINGLYLYDFLGQ